MSRWNDLLTERSQLDVKWRRSYLSKLNKYTGRDVIVYYSAWLTKGAPGDALSITQDDRTSFNSAIDSMLPSSQYLDLIIHTPGGDLQATKMIVQALRNKYNHIRVIVPHMAMSAGTMMALAADEIWLSDMSNLGPIDPQMHVPNLNAFIPAFEIIDVIDKAKIDLSNIPPKNTQYWAFQLQRYPHTLASMALNAIQQSISLTSSWLQTWMFKGSATAKSDADDVVKYFSDYQMHLSHGTNLSFFEISSALPLLKLFRLESDPKLYKHVYDVFYCYDVFLNSQPNIVKIIESHRMVGRVRIYNGK